MYDALMLGIIHANISSDNVRLRERATRLITKIGKNMKINKVLITTLLCVGVASAADARQRHHRRRAPAPTSGTTQVTPAEHHTITPSVVSTSAPGVWDYTANLSSGAVNNGDGFTIFDFGGYVAGSIFAPTGWDAAAVLTGSVLGVTPPSGYVDDPTLFNLEFTRTGGTVGPTNGVLNLGDFGATTTDTAQSFVAWSSRDHTPLGAVGADHADVILAPSAVPDGGSTVALLGAALVGLEGLRRMVRTRKA